MGKGREEVGYRLYVACKVLDMIKMVVGDSSNLDIGSDHNLIWGEVA